MNKLFTFLLLILVNFSASSQSDSLRPAFDVQKFEELRNSEEYTYERPKAVLKEASNDNTSSKAIGKLLSAIGGFLFSIYGVITMLVILALLIYFGFLRSRKKKAKEKELEDPAEIEYTVEIDDSYAKLNDRLKEAVKTEDYRLAIRFHFILLIKRLDHQKLIRFHKEKTNRQYALELPKEYRSDFKLISKTFEYTWYGNYKATLSLFEKNKALAKTFKTIKHVA